MKLSLHLTTFRCLRRSNRGKGIVMARYSRKRRSRRHSSIRRTDTSRRQSTQLETRSTDRRTTGRSSTPVSSRRKSSSGSGGIGSFLRKHIIAVAIAAFVVVVGGIVLGIVLGGKQTAPVAQDQQSDNSDQVAVAPEHTDMPEEDFDEYNQENGYNYDGVDDSVLAGLTGSDDSLFSENDQEMEDAVFAAEGIRIGVTLGNLETSTDKQYLSKMEQSSNEAEVNKLVYEVYYYNAQGDFNQQLQDVRSLIKNEVDAIIVANTDKEAFDMVVAMAKDAGIPVVAYNAPEGTKGYAINIVPDDKQWGTDVGTFMAQNLSSGNVLQVLGSDKVDVDVLRAAGITEGLAANEKLTTEDVIYAKWDEDAAYDAVTEFLADGYAAGIITEEGMAQGVLDAYIKIQKLPKVVCGDVSAGFIKTWYELKTKGVEIKIEPDDEDEDPYTIMFKAKPGEMTVLAQPIPANVGSTAFEIAYQLANGRTLKTEGQTFVYGYETVLTSDNLPKYYAMVSEKDDDYLLRDIISAETLDNLLNPKVEEEQTEGEEITEEEQSQEG